MQTKSQQQKKKRMLSWDTEKTNTTATLAAAAAAATAAATATAMLADIVAQFDYFLDPSLSFIRLLQAASFYLHVSLLYYVEHFYLLLLYAVARARGTLTTAQSCPLAVEHSVHWVAVQQQRCSTSQRRAQLSWAELWLSCDCTATALLCFTFDWLGKSFQCRLAMSPHVWVRECVCECVGRAESK